MKPAILSLAAALLLAPAIVGCAGEDAEAGDAAYPPVGYTPPPTSPPPAPPSAPPSAPRVRQPAVQLGAEQAAPGEGPQEDGQDDGPQEEGSAPDAPPAAGAWQWAPPDDGTGAGPNEGDPNASPGGGYADTDPSALSDFRSTLEPYGSWVDDPTYGTVWVPSESVVGSDFTPYVSAGHWAYDSDYAWVSDYDWGWAPFHYGRWAHGPGFGWEWIPGREYAGAWVSWRYGVDDWSYVGWAPLAPTWCWRGGVAVGIGFVPRAPYAFVGTGELFAPAVGGRVIAGPQVGVVASHTRPYVPSSSPGSPGSRVAARPSVGGPSPTDLHVAPESVTRSPADNRGLAQARAFSRPATAVALGARAPAGVAARTAPGAFSRGGDPVAAYRAPAASHFGGRRLGGGFAGSPAASAPMRSYPAYSGSPRPYYGSAPAASMRSPYAGRPYSAPTAIRSPPAGGAFRSAPAGGAFRSAAPSGGAFRPSPGASSFHGSGASGGFHGGGGGHASGHR